MSGLLDQGHVNKCHIATFHSFADVRGRQGRVPHLGPISFIFRQFSAKVLPNNRFLTHTQQLAALLGNPGSTTNI